MSSTFPILMTKYYVIIHSEYMILSNAASGWRQIYRLVERAVVGGSGARCRARAPAAEGGTSVAVQRQLQSRRCLRAPPAGKDRRTCRTLVIFPRPLSVPGPILPRSPPPSTFSYLATWPRGALRSTMPGRPQPASATRPVQGWPGGP